MASRSFAQRWQSRSSWGARPPKRRLGLPTAEGNTVHWEGPALGDYSHDTCPDLVRRVQNFHMDTRGWYDIAYSTLVCRHGDIFEGRGYGTRTGANGTNDGNRRSYAHCVLVGQGDTIPVEAKVAVRLVIEHFESLGSGRRRWCHRDWKATACAGDELCAFVHAGLPVPSTSTPAPSPILPAPTRDYMARGSRGGHVPQLQQILNALGAAPQLAVDGVFGSGTERALKAVQAKHGLTPDGIAGPQTLGLLYGLLGAASKPSMLPTPSKTIKQGDKGTDVTAWQTFLNGVSNAKLTVDGDFGAKTHATTRAFQAFFGLAPDGIVGPKTRAFAVRLAQHLAR